MRSKRREPAESHDRWLVSYADFITLLFAFFVVMFASTQTDRSRAKALSEAVRKALHEGTMTPKVATILGGTAGAQGNGNAMRRGPGGTRVTPETKLDPAPLNDLISSWKTLNTALKQQIQNGTVELKLESRGLVIGLKAASFFASGDDAVRRSAYPTVASVANVLNGLPNTLRLEGHTDSIPIQTPRFRSNWELSAARSIAMLRLLNERYDVDRRRMAIVGYADTETIDSNATEVGREKNRRVDIVILSEGGMRNEAQSSRRGAEANGSLKKD